MIAQNAPQLQASSEEEREPEERHQPRGEGGEAETEGEETGGGHRGGTPDHDSAMVNADGLMAARDRAQRCFEASLRAGKETERAGHGD